MGDNKAMKIIAEDEARESRIVNGVLIARLKLFLGRVFHFH